MLLLSQMVNARASMLLLGLQSVGAQQAAPTQSGAEDRAVLMAAKRERQARKRAKTAIESCAKSPAGSFTSGGGSFTSGKKRVGALDGPSFGVVASRAVAGGSAGAGWISDIPPPSDVPDPMREAELAFGIKADDHAQRAIADAAKSTGT